MKIKRIMPVILTVMLALCMFIPASLAASGIEFTAELSADETWIPPEGIVNFTVVIENTGTVDIERFEIITPDAKLVGEYDSLPAGESADVQLKEIIFDNPGEYPVSLFVAGYHGGDSWTVSTNEIVITVSSDPEPTPAPTAEPSAAPEPSGTTAAATAEASSASAVPSDAAASGTNAASRDDTVIYVVIVVLGVLAVGVIAAAIVIAAGRKQKQQ